jgi:serine/threonine-protein kinase HipA
MKCLITNEPWGGPGPYSPAGLRLLDRRLQCLAPLPYTRDQLLEEAAARAVKRSIQGMQPKVSTVLRVTEGRMELVDHGGRYIVKPPHLVCAELPENEALTMSLAVSLGIEVPVHGLLQNGDHTHSYFVRRFDRAGWGKVPMEDFAQLSGASRDTKYDSSTERLIDIIDRFCTFPALERLKFLDRMLCAYLTGNEDMHLKNFSLIVRGQKVELSPAYDLVNTTLVVAGTQEEVALPLKGKRRRLTRADWLDYWGRERLGLQARVLDRLVGDLAGAVPDMLALIDRSFLSADLRRRYRGLLLDRALRLGL